MVQAQRQFAGNQPGSEKKEPGPTHADLKLPEQLGELKKLGETLKELKANLDSLSPAESRIATRRIEAIEKLIGQQKLDLKGLEDAAAELDKQPGERAKLERKLEDLLEQKAERDRLRKFEDCTKLPIDPAAREALRDSLSKLDLGNFVKEVRKYLHGNNGDSGKGIELELDVDTLRSGALTNIIFKNSATGTTLSYQLERAEANSLRSTRNRIELTKTALLDILFCDEERDRYHLTRAQRGLNALSVNNAPQLISGTKSMLVSDYHGNQISMQQRLEDLVKRSGVAPQQFSVRALNATEESARDCVASSMARGGQGFQVVRNGAKPEQFGTLTFHGNSDFEGVVEIEAKGGLAQQREYAENVLISQIKPACRSAYKKFLASDDGRDTQIVAKVKYDDLTDEAKKEFGAKIRIRMPEIIKESDISASVREEIEAKMNEMSEEERRNYYHGVLHAETCRDDDPLLQKKLGEIAKGKSITDEATLALITSEARKALINDELLARCRYKLVREKYLENLVQSFCKETGTIGGKVKNHQYVSDLRDSTKILRSVYSEDFTGFSRYVDLDNVLISNRIKYKDAEKDQPFHFSRGDFSGTHFNNVILERVNMFGSTFTGSEWRGVKCIGEINAHGADFRNANWYHCEISMRIHRGSVANLDMHDSKITKGGVFDLDCDGVDTMTGNWRQNVKRQLEAAQARRAAHPLFIRDAREFWFGFKKGWQFSEGYFHGFIDLDREKEYSRDLIRAHMNQFLNGGTLLVSQAVKDSWEHSKTAKRANDNLVGLLKRGEMFRITKNSEKIRTHAIHAEPSELVFDLDGSWADRTQSLKVSPDHASIVLLDRFGTPIYITCDNASRRIAINKKVEDWDEKRERSQIGEYSNIFDDTATAEFVISQLVSSKGRPLNDRPLGEEILRDPKQKDSTPTLATYSIPAAHDYGWASQDLNKDMRYKENKPKKKAA